MSVIHHSISIADSGRTIVAIDDFSFVENEITFLFGESGIGKSLLCKALYGLLEESGLSVSVDGAAYDRHCADAWTRQVRRTSFFVFQEPSSHLNPLMRIGEQLAEGSLRGADNEREVLGRLWQDAAGGAAQRICEIYPKPYRPSGGEKQRILLAMAFKKLRLYHRDYAAGKPPTFYVFDEPTGSLDNAYRNLFLRLLFEAYAAGPFTALIITHDYSVISEMYRAHRSLLNRIHFKELVRANDGVVRLRDFSADEYLGWLRSQAPAVRGALAETEPVLTVEPSFGAFGRKLSIYGDAERRRPAPLAVRRGEIAYVKAPSGMGKTTLAKLVMGLYPADSLSMTLCGMRITHASSRSLWPREIWGKKAGMVFQHADEALDLEATVAETFTGLPLKQRFNDAAIVRLLGELFDAGEGERLLKRRVKYLSGGQKQRLNLLRSLVLDTELLILDEPLNALDFESIKRVLAMLEMKRRGGTALLMISHNEEIFDTIVDSAGVYYLGEENGNDQG